MLLGHPAIGEIMDSIKCTKCGKTSTSLVKCSHCGFEFPQPRTPDDEMEDRLFDEGNKSVSETTEDEMVDAMKKPLKDPSPRK
jgi:ribosomal protein L37E